jgi:hypothetical protein
MPGKMSIVPELYGQASSATCYSVNFSFVHRHLDIPYRDESNPLQNMRATANNKREPDTYGVRSLFIGHRSAQLCFVK